MLSPFICGTFHSDEDQDELGVVTAPKRSSAKKQTFRRARNSHRNRNPYSTRGLDKFEALLADLEEKKKKIYTKNDPGNISLVRFSYTSSNNLVPIVVKLKGKDSRSGSPPAAHETTKDKQVVDNTDGKRSGSEPKAGLTVKKAGDKNKRSSWKPWRPYYYLSAAVILILVLLMFFGRSVAILCTTVGWYAIPTLKGGSSGGEKAAGSGKKRELARRSSENKIVVTGRSPDRSPRQHGHRRSW